MGSDQILWGHNVKERIRVKNDDKTQKEAVEYRTKAEIKRKVQKENSKILENSFKDEYNLSKPEKIMASTMYPKSKIPSSNSESKIFQKISENISSDIIP